MENVSNSSPVSSKGDVKPKFGEFQLLGDSIFVRFAKSALLQRDRNAAPNTMGFCVSGQRINQLRRKIKISEYVLSRKVMILIGTNDVLCGRELTAMIRHFGKLLRLLKNRSVVKMVILTLPPVPKLSLTSDHWEVIRGFNQFLLGLASPPDKIRVLDIMPLFLKHDCPILAAPPTRKRKTCTSLEVSPLKIVKLSNKLVDSLDDEDEDKNGKPLSLFCQYLNRVNREDALKEAESSDDEESVKLLPNFIDYSFWRALEDQLPKQNLDESKSSLFNGSTLASELPSSRYTTPDLTVPFPSNTPSVVSPTSRFMTPVSRSPLSASNTPSELGADTPNSKPLPELVKNLLEYTNRFIRLDFYEKFYSGSSRLDMIHPNPTGLKALKKFIVESEVI